jgi:hypothetical protein
MKHFISFCCIVFLLSACIKETSVEKGANIYGQSTGTLKDSLGNCKSISINGTYKKNKTLTDSNFISVQVNVSIPGQYIIYSDTVNGCWFIDSGYVTVGSSTVKIQGYGKPTIAGIADFILNYQNSACLFSVPINDTTPVIPPVLVRDYFPTTIGSNWGYDVVGLDTLHVSASAKDTTIAGNVHRIFYSSGSMSDTAFYRKTGNEYFRWSSIDGTNNALAVLFLKENMPVNTQWETNVVNTVLNGIPTQAKMKYTLMAVNTNRTVNTNIFDSVIYVKNELQYKIMGNFQTIQTIHTYYAKNVGLIELEAPGILHQKLRRWKVY